MSGFLAKINEVGDKFVRGAKVTLNHLHGILTTAKSVATLVASVGTGISVAVGAPAWLTALVAFSGAVAAWEIPYDPFELKDYSG